MAVELKKCPTHSAIARCTSTHEHPGHNSDEFEKSFCPECQALPIQAFYKALDAIINTTVFQYEPRTLCIPQFG